MPNVLNAERTSAPAAETRTPGRRWSAFTLLVVAYFITIVDFTIVNVALPTIGRKLHFAESNLQWVVTAYGLTYAGFLLLGGRAADLLGRRRLLIAGLIIFTGASLGGGLATSDTFLIVMRGIQGLGSALVLPAALSTVMNMFPEGAERNKALGIWGGVGALGGTVGLLAGGVLTTYVGWRYIFLFNVPIGVVALVLIPRLIPESRVGAARRRYDPFGAVSITAALLVFVYAISQAPQAGWAAPQTVAMLVAGAALLAVFFVIETKVEAPLLPLRLFRLGSVAGSNAAGFLLGTSFLTFVFVGTLYMQQVLGFSALATGAAWMTASVTSLACANLSQKLVTRTSPESGHGHRHDPDRNRDPVGRPGSAERELLAGPGRAVLRGRHRHRLHLHPDLHRRAHRRHRTGRGRRLGAAQHHPEPRQRDRCGRGLVHRGLALPHPRPRWPLPRRRADRRLRPGHVGVRPGRAGGRTGGVRAHPAPSPAPRRDPAS